MVFKNQYLANESWVFWVVFILMGFFVALQSLEVALGLLVVAVGVHKVGSELRLRRMRRERSSLEETLNNVRELLERDYEYVRELQKQNDSRFFHLNKNRGGVDKVIEKRQKILSREIDKKLDETQRILIKKIIDLDNKLNDVSRAFLTKPPRSGRGK